jgi:hypothetical protein
MIETPLLTGGCSSGGSLSNHRRRSLAAPASDFCSGIRAARRSTAPTGAVLEEKRRRKELVSHRRRAGGTGRQAGSSPAWSSSWVRYRQKKRGTRGEESLRRDKAAPHRGGSTIAVTPTRVGMCHVVSAR